MKFATFDSEGVLSSRLIRGVNDIPQRAMEINEDLWMQITQEVDGVWMLVDGKIIKRPLPVVAPDLPTLVANERFKHETSGIRFEGRSIDTSRDSQALIAGAAVSAILDPNYHCNWKTGAGFVELQAPQLIAIATAVRTHIQACFDRELALLRAIDAGDYCDEMLAEGWPSSATP
ncbi:hypothetical protein D3C76_925020 [compost metagenome]